MSSTFIQQRVRSVISSEPVKWAALSCVCSAGIVALYFQDPNQAGGFLPPCPIYALTGTYCPGCGAARALHGLLHGDVIVALGYNPLLIVALPFVAAVLGSYALRWTRQRPLPAFVTSRTVGLVAVWVVGIYWVVRNIPLFPFTVLAP